MSAINKHHLASTLSASYPPNLASVKVNFSSSKTFLGNVVINFTVVMLPPFYFLMKFIISPIVFDLKNFLTSFEPSGILNYMLHTVLASASAGGSSGTAIYPIASSFIDAIIAEIISGSSPYSAAND